MKTIGKLEVICGPMYAGKSTENLKRILWEKNGLGNPVRVFKPAFDTRYSETELVSHDGLKTEAENIKSLPTIEYEQNLTIFIDEIQFFIEPYVTGDVVSWIGELIHRGINVVVSGLDMDSNGFPFKNIGELMAMSDKITRLTSNCSICGREATRTTKISQNNDRFFLGDKNEFEPRCTTHWIKNN